jgi:hypothetical protein
VRNLLDTLGDRPAVFRFERNGLEDQQIKSALDKIGWLCRTPRLPTIVDGQTSLHKPAVARSATKRIERASTNDIGPDTLMQVLLPQSLSVRDAATLVRTIRICPGGRLDESEILPSCT